MRLSRTFGDELSAARWLSFKSHYELVLRTNACNNAVQWRDPEYRAIQLRQQITGEQEQWLNQAEQSGEAWMQSDDDIIDRFDRRFVTADGIELAIRRFEDTRQEAGEDLGPFMSRLRRLAGFAFIQENEDSRRSRIIWKFVSEIREESVRRDVIRQKWIGADGKAKSYNDVLATALDAQSVLKATEPCGTSAAPVQQDALVAAINDLSRRFDSVMQGEAGRYRARQRSGAAGNQPRSQRVLRCWYCSREHPGGWQNCRRRAQEMPNWQPNRRPRGRNNVAMIQEESGQPGF